VLAELPGVLECLVVGVPDDEWGQRVVALVVGREGHTPAPDDLRQTVAARLGPAAVPRTSHLVRALPRTALGKPDRAAAARLAASLDAGADTDRRG
jgi:O-succinylbenzoic acid--CoA ligase